MTASIPTSLGDLLKDAATAEISKSLDKGFAALDSGDSIGAAQAFSQATAVGVVYATVTALSMTFYHPVTGLGHAFHALGKSPSTMGKVLSNLGLVKDPLVLIRMEN